MHEIETIYSSEGCNNTICYEMSEWRGFYFKLVYFKLFLLFISNSSQLQQSPDCRSDTPRFPLQYWVEMVCRCGHTCMHRVGSCAGGTRWCSSYCALTYTCQAFSPVPSLCRLSPQVRLHCPGRIVPLSQHDCLPLGDTPHMVNFRRWSRYSVDWQRKTQTRALGSWFKAF